MALSSIVQGAAIAAGESAVASARSSADKTPPISDKARRRTRPLQREPPHWRIRIALFRTGPRPELVKTRVRASPILAVRTPIRAEGKFRQHVASNFSATYSFLLSAVPGLLQGHPHRNSSNQGLTLRRASSRAGMRCSRSMPKVHRVSTRRRIMNFDRTTANVLGALGCEVGEGAGERLLSTSRPDTPPLAGQIGEDTGRPKADRGSGLGGQSAWLQLVASGELVRALAARGGTAQAAPCVGGAR